MAGSRGWAWGRWESPLSVSLFRWESPDFLCANLSCHVERHLESQLQDPRGTLDSNQPLGPTWPIPEGDPSNQAGSPRTPNPILCSAPGQIGSAHSLSWKPQDLRNLQHLLNGQIKRRKIYLFHLFNTVLIMTITPNLCGMAGSLHKKFQYRCFSQHSIYKAKAVLDFGVSWCGNLQLKNRFELKPCFLKRFWCAEWNQKYLESNFSKQCQELCVPLGRGEAGILQGKRDLKLKNLYLQSHNVVWLWDPAKLGLFPPIFHVCHMRAVMLIIPEEQWTSPPPQDNST